MKKTVTFVFDLNENENEHELDEFLSAHAAHRALEDIANNIFRPARKHGYPDLQLAAFFDDNNPNRGLNMELVSLLEEVFFEIIRENDIKIH